MALNDKQMERLSRLSKDELLDFIDMFQKNWWNLQNNYIMYLDNEYGQEAAMKADGHCFSANAKVQMYRLTKMFGLKNDLNSLKDAMILSTIWANCDYDILDIDENQLYQLLSGMFIPFGDEIENGYVIISLHSRVLGMGLCIDGMVRSQLPRKGLAFLVNRHS